MSAAGVERPCPVCGAPVGHPCFTVTAGPTVHIVSTHRQRLEVVPCPWCGAGAGAPCVTRAAHPVTGRAMLLEVEPHPERLEVHA